MRKEQRRLVRRKASLEGLPSVLVICEGRETEPNYVEGLRDYQRVDQLKAELRANGASAPDIDMPALVEQFRRMQRS